MAATADFIAAKVTLDSAATAYCLYDLLYAIDTATPIRACEVQIQAVTVTNPILVGDKNISATRFGWSLQGQTTALAGQERTLTFRHQKNTIHLKSIYLWAVTTTNMVLNVSVWTS